MGAELAFYPAVALLYFFGVLRASQEERVELDEAASVNVFLLFVLAQPLCLLAGGYAGMAAYLLTALGSYHLLPWRGAQEAQEARRKAAERKKRKEE